MQRRIERGAPFRRARSHEQAQLREWSRLGSAAERERDQGREREVDRVNGLDNVQVDIVMMRTPDGHGRLELTKFRNPQPVAIEPAIAPPNTPGLRSVMFTVESVDDTVARLRANGAELVGEVVQYEDKYRLCYMRGPAGIIVSLAEELF